MSEPEPVKIVERDARGFVAIAVADLEAWFNKHLGPHSYSAVTAAKAELDAMTTPTAAPAQAE